MITQEFLKKQIHYEPETGLFTRIGYFDSGGNFKHRNNLLTKTSAEGYLIISIGGKRYKSHRLVFLYMDGVFPDDETEIDHADGNRSNNRYSNLILSNRKDNAKNKKKYSSNTSGVSGVTLHGCGLWRARINVDGKRVSLGLFENFDDAVKARKDAEIKYNYSENHGR